MYAYEYNCPKRSEEITEPTRAVVTDRVTVHSTWMLGTDLGFCGRALGSTLKF